MDFISNLIKRPISLVLNDTAATADKLAISSPTASSLPNSPSALTTNQTDSSSINGGQQEEQLLHNSNNNNDHNGHNDRPLSASSSSSTYNGSVGISIGNITDFIGVPDEFLGEFEDILPPPPPLSQSPLNMADYNRSLSITPPPPLTPAMKASQTIDELLSEINDNLQQAGLNDDILLAIASPPNNSELSPVSSKAALNNSKSNSSSEKCASKTTPTPTTVTAATNSQTPATAAGTAATTVFEANSSLHKFHIDPDLETGLFDDQQQQKQLNTSSGVNKSSNKFVGLTEFDEAKIPELPGDLNPNIEEQYSVTFEKCFIPTLTVQQGSEVPDDYIVDKTHLLLPTETNSALSSDSETFADCQDEEKDPLANTIADVTGTFDTTTDMEAFQSANNNTINVELSDTMDNIHDITMEAEGELPLLRQQLPVQQTQVVEEMRIENLPQYEAMDKDEPMDIDMNATMEIIQNSSSNIQHVEQVLQHAENILQHIEEKKPFAQYPLATKPSEISKMSLKVNENATQQHLEMEQSKHELSLNKSFELPIQKSKTISSECIIETVQNEEKKSEENLEAKDVPTSLANENVAAPASNELNLTKDFMNSSTGSSTSLKSPKLNLNEQNDAKENLEAKDVPTSHPASSNNLNLTIDCMNSSTGSSTSLKSPKLNLTSGMSSSMTSSKKSSAPSSPSFPLKHSQSAGFPRCPKAVEENPHHMPFLEKSDYSENSQLTKSLTQMPRENLVTNWESVGKIRKLKSDPSSLNETYVDAPEAKHIPLVANNLNGTFVEPPVPVAEEAKEIPFVADNLNGTYVEPSNTLSLNETYVEPPVLAAITAKEIPSAAENLNGTFVESSTSDPKESLTENLNGGTIDSLNKNTSSELNKPTENTIHTKDKHLIFVVDSPKKDISSELNKPVENNNPCEIKIDPTHDKGPTLGVDSLNQDLSSELNKPEENTILREAKIDPTQDKRLTFGVDSLKHKDALEKLPVMENPAEFKSPSIQNRRLTFGVDSLSQDEALGKSPELVSVPLDDKRRTFSIQPSEASLSTETVKQFPSLDISDTTRRTFNVNAEEEKSTEEKLSTTKNDGKSRRTFNVSSDEQTAMDISDEAMDVDDNMGQNTSIPVSSNAEQKSQNPPLPNMQGRPQSPPLPAIQQRSQSPPLPALQKQSQSPPIPTKQSLNKFPEDHATSRPPPPLPPRTMHRPIQIKEEPISPLPSPSSPPSTTSSLTAYSSESHPFSNIQKRPSIHDHRAARARDILSAKEQSNDEVKDEKDVFVEQFTPSPVEDIFTAVSATSTANSCGFTDFDQNAAASSSSTSASLVNNAEQLNQQQQFQQEFEDEFQGNNNLILNPSDFDYLLTKGNNNAPVDRSSLLLKFDPLLGVPVPVNQGQQQQLQQPLQQLQIPTNTLNNPCLSPTLEEDEHNDSNRSFVVIGGTKPGLSLADETNGAASAKLLKERTQEVKEELKLEQRQHQQQEVQEQLQQLQQQSKSQLPQGGNKKNATMSVDVIKDIKLDNDCNKTIENSNSQSDDKQINYKMDELEKKIKNEVLKTEDIEKKLKDAEQREEALIKRITEKDKTVSKMNGVIEAYEKAIAELIAEKEQLIQNYEKQLAEVQADRDSNYHHLTSLETTFSDLHVKYEKSKEMTCQLKSNEDSLIAENRKTLENLRLQEQRYDKMKNHAMQQLEIANKKLESLTRDHAIESTKLKALLKKEEIARSSINEQLAQKTKENSELLKICDELITGQGR